MSSTRAEHQIRPTFRLFAVWRLMAAGFIMVYHFSIYGPVAFSDFVAGFLSLMPMLDMFFIISGFLIWTHYSTKLQTFADFKYFLVRRIVRIYPLHLLTLAFFCIVGLAIHFGFVSSGSPERYSLSELFKQILLINAWGVSDILSFNYVSWSLSAEWFCYLLFPLLVLAFRKAGIVGLALLLGASVFTLEGLTYLKLMPFPTWLEANTWGAYRVFADFVLGAFIAELASRRLLRVKSQLVAWCSFIFAIDVMLYDPAWGYWSMAAIAVALYLAAQVEINAPHRSSYLMPLMPAASLSFGLYLWHPVIANVVLGLVWRRFLEPLDILPFAAIMPVAMIATFVTAFLSARYFEQPVRRFVLNWAKRNEPASENSSDLLLSTK